MNRRFLVSLLGLALPILAGTARGQSGQNLTFAENGGNLTLALAGTSANDAGFIVSLLGDGPTAAD